MNQIIGYQNQQFFDRLIIKCSEKKIDIDIFQYQKKRMKRQNPEDNKKQGILGKIIGEARYNIDRIKQAYGFSDQITSYRHKLDEDYVFPASIKGAQVNRLRTKFQKKDDIDQEFKNMETSAFQEVYIRELLNSKKVKRMETEFSILDFVTIAPYQMSSDMTMFFHFLQYLIMFLLLKILLVDLYNGLSSLNYGYFCHQNPQICFQSFFTELSLFNKVDQKNLILIVDVLNLVFVGVSIMFLLIFRQKQRKLFQQLNKGKISQQQYTILVENIPIIVGQSILDLNNNLIPNYQKQIETIFTNQIKQWINQVENKQRNKKRPLQQDLIQNVLHAEASQQGQFSKNIITSISLCYDLRQFYKIIDLKHKIISRYQQFQPTKDRQDQKNLSQERQRKRRIIKQVKTLNKLQLEIMKNFFKNRLQFEHFKTSHFLGSAFVSFQYIHYAQHIIQKAKQNDDFLKFPGTQEKMKVSVAVKPKFINWRNISLDQQQRKSKVIKSSLILLSALVLSFFTLFFLCFQQQQQIQRGNQNQIIKKYYSIMFLCLLISIISKLVHLVIRHIGNYRKYPNIQQQFYDVLMLSVFSRFIVNGVLYFLVTAVLQKHILNYYGIVIEINSLIIFSCLLQILLGIVDWPNYLKYFDIWWTYRNLSDNQDSDKIKTFQGKFNKKYELAEFDLISKLSFYISQTYIAFLYSYVCPTAVPILFVFLLIQYWIDQYNLFKRSKQAEFEIKYELLRKIMKLFDFSLPIWALGTLFFSIEIKDGIAQNILNFFVLLIASGYLFLVVSQSTISQRLFSTIEKPRNINYTTSQLWFNSTYWKENPATLLRQQKIETGYNDDRDQFCNKKPIKKQKFINIDEESVHNQRQRHQMKKIQDSNFSY